MTRAKKKPAEGKPAGNEPTDISESLPGLPQPQPQPEQRKLSVRGLTGPLFSRVLKQLGRCPHDDVAELMAELMETPVLEVKVQ